MKHINNKLYCTLVRHVFTDDGDFVPAGTPCRVMGYATFDPLKSQKLTVRVTAYVHAGEWNREAAVNDGLYIDVDPDNLKYESYHLD